VSKTQQAYEGALRGDKASFDSLVWMCIVKCRGIWPPAELCSGADNLKHAARRRQTNRYSWIEDWLREELRKPQHAKATGAGMVQRCRWRLLNYIEREPRRLAREEDEPSASPFGTRIRRDQLADQAYVVDLLSTLNPPQDPVLLDLWERILSAYPDWKATTNLQLAGALGVHPNVIGSRRAALAVCMHLEATSMQAAYLTHGLRLRIGKIRKTDIHRVECQTETINRQDVASPSIVGRELEMDWSGRWLGFNQPPSLRVEAPGYVLQPRCPHFYRDGRQCTNTAKSCPGH